MEGMLETIPAENEKEDMSDKKIFTCYVGDERIYLTKIQAINTINILSGQLLAYELARN